MNRRGFFGALAGSLAAVIGLRPRVEGTFDSAGAAVALSDLTGKASPLPAGYVFTSWQQLCQDLGMPPAEHSALTLDPIRFCERDATDDLPTAPDTAPAPPTAPVDLPTIWPGVSGEITATASLPPFLQVERLIDLFGQSGDSAPAFAAALIGELVLTRMRLAAAHPRTLCTLAAELP